MYDTCSVIQICHDQKFEKHDIQEMSQNVTEITCDKIVMRNNDKIIDLLNMTQMH